MKAFFRSHPRALVPIDTKDFRRAMIRLVLFNLFLFLFFLIGSELIRTFGYHYQQAYLCFAIASAALALGCYQMRKQFVSRRIAWRYPDLPEKTKRAHEAFCACLYLWPGLNIIYLAWLARRHVSGEPASFLARHPGLCGVSLVSLALARWAILIAACFGGNQNLLPLEVAAPAARAFALSTDVRLIKVASSVSKAQDLSRWLRLQSPADFLSNYEQALANPSFDSAEFLIISKETVQHFPGRLNSSSAARERYRNVLWRIDTNLWVDHFWVARRHATLSTALLSGGLFDSSIQGFFSVSTEIFALTAESRETFGSKGVSPDISPASKQAFRTGTPGRQIAAYEQSWLSSVARKAF